MVWPLKGGRPLRRHRAGSSAPVEYAAGGKVLGLPVSFLHAPIRAVYNNPVVTRVRTWYAARRGVEAGDWFDIHAAR